MANMTGLCTHEAVLVQSGLYRLQKHIATMSGMTLFVSTCMQIVQIGVEISGVFHRLLTCAYLL